MEYIGWLYLATRLDTISHTFEVLCFVSGFITFATLLASIDAKGDTLKTVHRWRGWAIFVLVISIIGVALTPSKRDAMFIAGGVGVIEASKALAGSEIAKKSVGVIEAWLDSQLTELKAPKTAPAKSGK